MKNEIQKLIDEFGAQGWKSNPYDLTCRLIDSDSEHVLTLVEMVLDQLPKSGTFFADAISFVPENELLRLAGLAIATLSKGGEQETAEEFITHCSLQRVEALHPYLADIYKLKPNWSSYYSDWPWRKSGLLHFEFLKRVAEDTSNSDEAWKILLETRHPVILKYCADHAEQVGDSAANYDFREVGFELKAGVFRQLYTDDVKHLIFPGAYLQTEKPAPHMTKRHPTWRCEDAHHSSLHRFGGSGAHTCSACGNQGHHLLSLAQIPKHLPITALSQIRFETCLSCLGWEVPQMFYRHENNGDVVPVGYEGPRIVPQFPSEPFIETEIHLAQTPARWQWQDWAVANSRQNLHRVGGHPCWIQRAEYVSCPLCRETMNFLFQLDSDLLTGAEESRPGEFLWGSGGICYGHWCDQCKVSGYLWQCT